MSLWVEVAPFNVNPSYGVQITPVFNVSMNSCGGTVIDKEEKDLDHERLLTKGQLEVGAVLAKSEPR